MSWISVITSYLSPNINHLSEEEDDSAGNSENDFFLSLEEEITFENNENGSPVSSVSLPKNNRKFCFYVIYCTFVTSYIVCFFATAYTYPLKPTCHIDKFYLPSFDKDLSATKEIDQSVYLLLSINNRNRLISASYDHFNITIYYLPTRNTSIYFASTITPGFYQRHKLDQTKVIEVQMPAPGLPVLLQLQRPLSEMHFRVNLEFTVRFGCRTPCKYKQHFIRLSTSRIYLKYGTRNVDDIVMMN